MPSMFSAHRGGVEVGGWTVDRTIRVRFPDYPHRVWALWWQGGKRCLQMSRCLCWGRLGTLKTRSCPWRYVPGSRSKFRNWTTVLSLYSWNIAEYDVKPQPTSHVFFLPVQILVITSSQKIFVTETSLWSQSFSLSNAPIRFPPLPLGGFRQVILQMTLPASHM